MSRWAMPNKVHIAGNAKVERIISWLQQPLRKIGPLALNHGSGGGGVQGILVRGFGSKQRIELAIPFVSARRSVSDIVGQEVERLHTSSQPTGGQNTELVH